MLDTAVAAIRRTRRDRRPVATFEGTVTQIRIEGLGRSYGETLALSCIDLQIGSGELFFLLGPSGCGKSTLLRLIAGLQMPTRGRILFDGRDVTPVPTKERNAVMCFQGYALWPHMSVRENIRFGLSVRDTPSDRRAQVAEVQRALEIVQMTGPLADRKPQELSGGQQQRVALARALVVRPACLLLDEPLSNLDAQLRQELRREIRRVCKEAGITTLYVTHDQDEALSTADRIAVMQGGGLAQVGTPQELYRSPASAFVARFMGATNLIEGDIVASSDGLTHVSTAVGHIVAAGTDGFSPGNPASGHVTVSIRPELIRIVRGGGQNRANRLVGASREDTFLGQSSEHVIAVGNGHLRVVSVPPQAALEPEVILEFDPADAVVLLR